MPIAPTLILGLGGTGSRIVEKVAEKVSESETGQSERIAFVVFDTDINDLGRIRDDNPSIFTVQTSTRNTVGQYLGINTNARDNWFPVNEMMNRKTLTDGAAQVRAISRLAFDTTLKSGNLRPLHDAIEQLFRIDKDQEEQSLRVIITSSLAGGTGSGIILSVAMYLANYLRAKYPKAKAITRGFFIQPDVFYKVIPAMEEQQNLQVNAYAAIRELDAFLMKGDNTLPPQYSELRFEFPQVGGDGFEEVKAMPYDFCFLFEAHNSEQNNLDSFAAYMDHAATCIYTQSIGPMSKKSNSREDNVLREVIKNDGRNRYAGAGASRLVYPWYHLRDYTGYKWAQHALSAQWLQFDDIYLEQKAAQMQQREAGYAVKDLDPGQVFISAVDEGDTNKDPFAKAIKSQTLTFDEEGITVTGNQWEHYVGALENYVIATNEDPALAVESNNISAAISDLGSEVDNDEYVSVFQNLERLRLKTERAAEDRGGILGYTLFKSDAVDPTKSRDKHRLETYLISPSENTFIHPVAVRYFLYQTEALLKAQRKRVQSDLESLERYFKDFEAKHFEVPKSDEPGNTALWAAQRPSLKERITGKPGPDKRELAEAFVTYQRRINELGADLVFSAVLDDALIYVRGMIDSFQKFFSSLRSNLERLDRDVARERAKYDDLSGSTTRYVLATSDSLDAMYAQMPFTGGVTVLTPGLSEKIYGKVRDYYMLKDEKDDGFFNELYEKTILGDFAEQVMDSYSGVIKMDIIDALEREYRVISGEFDERKAAHYVRDEIKKAQRLAAPFIQQPLGEERHPIEACAYNPSLEGDADPKRKSLVSELLGNYGGERDKEISPQEILFYNAIYGIRAADLTKFAPPANEETEVRDAGEYFSAYFRLVSGIKPSVSETKVITPHVDRRWHSINALPDLHDGNQAAQLRSVHEALLVGIVYGRIEWSPSASTRVYKYKNRNNQLEEFVVSNGTPCDEFYEVVDGLTVNATAVEEILTYVNKRIENARSATRTASFANTEFGQALNEGLHLPQLRRMQEEQRLTTTPLSIFGMAAFYAFTIPHELLHEHLLRAMVEDFIAYVGDDLRSVTHEEAFDEEFEDVLLTQLRYYDANLTNYLELAGISFLRWLRVILGPVITLAEEKQLLELLEKATIMDEYLLSLLVEDEAIDAPVRH